MKNGHKVNPVPPAAHLAPKQLPKVDMINSFKQPAVIVNNFIMTRTNTYLRLTAVENDQNGNSNLRFCMAMDFQTMMGLANLLASAIQSVMQAEAAKNEAAQPKLPEGTDEKAPDDTEAKVGVDIQA